MTATEKAQLAELKQITNQQSVEIDQLRQDVKEILAVTNEFRGGQKLLKWAVATTIALGALATAIISIFESK